MDTEIGRILNELTNQGFMNNTNIFFIGDNGTTRDVIQPPFDPLRGKGSLYEGGVRVPLIATGPNVKWVGQSAALVNHTDLFSTIVDMASKNWNHTSLEQQIMPGAYAVDSKSFFSLPQNPNADNDRKFLFAERFDDRLNIYRDAMRDERFKIIRDYSSQGYREEFYDLQADPFEAMNLLDPANSGNRTQLGIDAYIKFKQDLQGLVGF
jgi:arylsulfatase A-like enzyme